MSLTHYERDGKTPMPDNNYMSYGTNPNSFTLDQMKRITEASLNQGTNYSVADKTTKNRYWHYSTNEKPYIFNMKRGEKIPKILYNK